MSMPWWMATVAGTTDEERQALQRKRESDEAARRYAQGQSIKEIAAAMRRSYGTIHSRLRAANVTMRRGRPRKRQMDTGGRTGRQR
jgi:DNA-directed RNA polymerase specialized sigma24 family protein